MTELRIRPATNADRDAIWRIFRAVVASGDTYAFPEDMPREEALAAWMGPGIRTFVAEDDSGIVGTYTVNPNQQGRGDHVANCAYMVAPKAQGRGVGHAMAERSLEDARALGYRAVQFDFVVSTNEPAIRLYRDLGFEVVGTLPGAFRHPEQGEVDVYVMYRRLD